jgi:hypothetical protein
MESAGTEPQLRVIAVGPCHVTTSANAVHENHFVSTEFLTGRYQERYHRASKAVRVLPYGFFDDALFNNKMVRPTSRLLKKSLTKFPLRLREREFFSNLLEYFWQRISEK